MLIGVEDLAAFASFSRWIVVFDFLAWFRQAVSHEQSRF